MLIAASARCVQIHASLVLCLNRHSGRIHANCHPFHLFSTSPQFIDGTKIGLHGMQRSCNFCAHTIHVSQGDSKEVPGPRWAPTGTKSTDYHDGSQAVAADYGSAHAATANTTTAASSPSCSGSNSPRSTSLASMCSGSSRGLTAPVASAAAAPGYLLPRKSTTRIAPGAVVAIAPSASFESVHSQTLLGHRTAVTPNVGMGNRWRETFRLIKSSDDQKSGRGLEFEDGDDNDDDGSYLSDRYLLLLWSKILDRSAEVAEKADGNDDDDDGCDGHTDSQKIQMKHIYASGRSLIEWLVLNVPEIRRSK